MKAVRNPTDFWSGLVFLAIGTTFLVIGQRYQFGTPLRMGPSFFPIVLSSLLLLLGSITLIRSFIQPGEAISRFAIKGMLVIVAGAVAFGVLAREAGIVPAVLAMTVITAYGSVKFKWKTAIIMAICLAAFCSLVFVYALGLPMPYFGEWFGE